MKTSDAKLRILVAEDNPINRLFLGKLLDSLDVAWHAAENGEEVVTSFAREHYDLILMDCLMPVCDGYEAARKIRATDKGRRIPIYAMSADPTESMSLGFRDSGMSGFLAKPIRPNELRALFAAVSARTSSNLGSALNAETVKELLESDETGGLLSQLIQLFHEYAPETLSAVTHAVNARDSESIRRQAHRLKGFCLNLGADALSEVCSALEEMGKSGDFSGGNVLLARAEFEMTRLRRALEALPRPKTNSLTARRA